MTNANNILTSSMVAALQDDEEVAAASKALALKALSEADFLLTNGMPSVKIQVIKFISPIIAKALQVSSGESELTNAIAEVRGMYAEMMEKVDGKEDDDNADV